MELVLIGFGVGFVGLIAYYIMKESDETKRRKDQAVQRIARIRREREAQVEAEYLRQAHKHITPASRSGPITTGRPKNDPQKGGFLRGDKITDVSDNFVDTYTTPTYHSSHSSGGHSYSSHSCSSSSSSSSDSGSSSSDSGGGGCD